MIEKNQTTNQPGRNSKKGNPRKILTIFDQRQMYFRQEPCALLLINLIFKADRLQMIVVAKKYICVATVHQ